MTCLVSLLHVDHERRAKKKLGLRSVEEAQLGGVTFIQRRLLAAIKTGPPAPRDDQSVANGFQFEPRMLVRTESRRSHAF